MGHRSGQCLLSNWQKSRLLSKRPRLKRVALFPGRAGDKRAEHVASFNEQRDPQAKPAVLQYFGKTAVNNKSSGTLFLWRIRF